MPVRLLIRTALLSITLGFFAAGACYIAASISLGLFLGPLIFAAILTPPLALSRENIRAQGAAVAGIAFGISAVWAVAAIRSEYITLVQWLQCTLVLAAMLIALWGIASLISRATRDAVYASAITILLGLLWMTWPVWLSHGLAKMSYAERVVAWLVPMHPPLVVSTLLDMGVWGEQRIAYHLTTLGQDVAYRPPAQSWGAIAVHLTVGVVSLGISKFAERKLPRRRDIAKYSDEQIPSTS